ncbi:outer membrane beta-barrel protein [Amaricoccus sp.]|uniref:outer membrane beta-barrel protein n=1 Tax=Amaricoccus sp. TaxID=1872485 RepID=UPI001B6512F7|nr:outer membrane beta-barrel protein [Amaricoccus sp.]MBP7242713.1 outer membrane beta-barrel protein [Amaricoccus sp.]
MRTIAAIAMAATAFGAAAAAQEFPGGWTFDVTVYAWLPALSSSLDTKLGRLDADLSSGDVISNLDFAFMGALEARTGRWGFIGDLIYSDISMDSSTPRGLLFTKGVADTEMTVFSGYAAYRLHEDDKVAFDVAAGVRAFSVDLDFTLKGNLAETRHFGDSQSWAVPLVGARAIVKFSDRWTGTLFADLGGVSSDETTWQALATVRYAINDDWSAVAAYRYMDIDYQIDDKDASVELYGPAIGVVYRF